MTCTREWFYREGDLFQPGKADGVMTACNAADVAARVLGVPPVALFSGSRGKSGLMVKFADPTNSRFVTVWRDGEEVADTDLDLDNFFEITEQ